MTSPRRDAHLHWGAQQLAADPEDEVIALVLGQRLQNREAERRGLGGDRELRGVALQARIVHERILMGQAEPQQGASVK